MRCSGMVSALCVTAAVLFSGGAPAFADPSGDTSPEPANTPAPASSAYSEKFLYYSGFDLWRSGGTFYGGVQWAPGSLNSDGFTLKLLLAEGSYRYLAGTTNIRGRNFLGAIMPGWRIKRGDLEVKVFAGLDVQNHSLSPDDPANNLRGTHAGLRIGADLWWEPTSKLMLSSSISGSTVGNSFGVRGAAGWRLADSFWTGPEIEASGDEVYRQYRIGAHLTSVKFAAFEWSLGAGYVEDNSHRSGLYGRVSLLTRR